MVHRRLLSTKNNRRNVLNFALYSKQYFQYLRLEIWIASLFYLTPKSQTNEVQFKDKSSITGLLLMPPWAYRSHRQLKFDSFGLAWTQRPRNLQLVRALNLGCLVVSPSLLSPPTTTRYCPQERFHVLIGL